MLIDFSVANFRSICVEQSLNLVASRAQTGHEDHCIPIPGVSESVLRAAVIYGANSAGKSNLVRAIEFARDMIVEGSAPLKRIALNQFRFTEASPQPSCFEFRFVAEGRVFVYGFEVTKDEVLEEWLAAMNDHGKELDIYHRKRREIEFGDLSRFGAANKEANETLGALRVLGVRPNQLLLNKIVDLDSANRGELLSRVVWWFSDCLTVITPDARFVPIVRDLDADPAFRSFVGESLCSVDTGIGGLAVEKTVLTADQLPKQIVEGLQSVHKRGGDAIVLGPGLSLSLDPQDSTRVIRHHLSAIHRIDGREFAIPFNEESDGTQRFVDLLPALYHLQMGAKVFVIDELDRSLHPLLAHAFVRFFVESCPGSNQQMIVTTHETHLLDLELLRRDEIWFAEKAEDQQTKLYSLSELNVRKDLRLEKSYLQGRFGAVPLVAGLERLKDLVANDSGA